MSAAQAKAAAMAAKGALGSLGSSLAQAAQPQPKPKAEPSPQDNLRRTARTLWVLSYGLLYVALGSHGWQRTEYQGARVLDGQTFHQTTIGNYGIKDIVFEVTSGAITVPYRSWSLAQAKEGDLSWGILAGVQASAVAAAVTGALVALAHVRAWCARTPEMQAKFTTRSAHYAIPQFLATALAVGLWKAIPPSAFEVFCTQDGCVREDRANITAAAVSYAWVFGLVSAVVALFLALTLWRLAHYDDGSANDGEQEVEVPLAYPSGAGATHTRLDVRGLHYVYSSPAAQQWQQSQSSQALASPSKAKVMGAAAPSPRTEAEAWNPQQQRRVGSADYKPLGRGLSGGGGGGGGGSGGGKGGSGKTAPSWLEGV